MLHPDRNLNFASLRPKINFSDFVPIKSQKNTGISRTVKFGEHSRPSTRDGLPLEDQLKVVKLIGNQNQNIEEIMSSLNCHCGCRAEFKKILVLLMGKIYKLREERNELRQQLKAMNKELREGRSVGVGINTEQDLLQEHMREQLLKLINESKLKSLPSEIQQNAQVSIHNPLPTEGIFDIGINRYTSITFEHEANETNLLSQAQMQKEHERSRLSFQNSQSLEERQMLKQCHNTENNRLGDLKSYCNQRSLDLCTIQEYIQKMNCAKQLNRYETQKRKNTIF